jgi:hypothetical protein
MTFAMFMSAKLPSSAPGTNAVTERERHRALMSGWRAPALVDQETPAGSERDAGLAAARPRARPRTGDAGDRRRSGT